MVNHHLTANQKHKFSKLLSQNLYTNTHLPLNSSCRKGKKQETQMRTVGSLPKEMATDLQKSKMANLINQHLILFKKSQSYHCEATNKGMDVADKLWKIKLIKQEKGKLTPSERRTVAYLHKKQNQAIKEERKAKRLAAKARSKAKEFQAAINECNKKLHVPYPLDLHPELLNPIFYDQPASKVTASKKPSMNTKHHETKHQKPAQNSGNKHKIDQRFKHSLKGIHKINHSLRFQYPGSDMYEPPLLSEGDIYRPVRHTNKGSLTKKIRTFPQACTFVTIPIMKTFKTGS